MPKVKRDHNQKQKRHRFSGRSNLTLCFIKRTINITAIKYTELINRCKQASLSFGGHGGLASKYMERIES